MSQIDTPNTTYDNLTFLLTLLTSSGQEWQFHMSTYM